MAKATSEEKFAPIKERLGKVGDGALAAEIGVHRSTVRAYRQSLGIAQYDGYLWAKGKKSRNMVRAEGGEVPEPAATPKRARQRGSARTSRLDAYKERLGVESDAAIARAAGVTPAAVQLYRKRYGISKAPKVPAGNVTPFRALPRVPQTAQAPEASTSVTPRWVCTVLVSTETLEEAIQILRQGGGGLAGVHQMRELPPGLQMLA